MSIQRLPKEIERALEQTGLPWELEQRGKHFAIRLAGRVIGVTSLSPRAARKHHKTMVTNIRRATRQLPPQP